MPLLTIITRTFNGRPIGLAANIASVERQLQRQEIQHLVAVDAERRGVVWTHWNLRNLSPSLTGDYVMLLDDDDFLVDTELVPGLMRQVALSPEVVMTHMNMGDGRILPSDEDWGQSPKRSGVPCSSYIVRRDVWNEHVADFASQYDGDYEFIKAVWDCGHPFHWWKRVIARVGQISHGKSEDGSPDPFLSTAR